MEQKKQWGVKWIDVEKSEIGEKTGKRKKRRCVVSVRNRADTNDEEIGEKRNKEGVWLPPYSAQSFAILRTYSNSR